MVSTSPATTVHDAARKRTVPRQDIQALRALAVGLVLVYHFRPDWVPGGFIGVDVFFVISGYLITSHLVREARSKGRVSLASFWAARARRILPAALVTIAVTITVTLAFLAPTQGAQLTREAIASIFYVQNWRLAADSVDYLAAENVASPFQHFWTLAVEEQFYLAWPLLVVLALVVSRRRGRTPAGHVRGGRRGEAADRRMLRVLATVFGVVCLASFAWSVVAVAGRDPSAFFVTTTRVWELGAGGLLSLVVVRARPVVVRGTLVVLGLAAILVVFLAVEGTPGLVEVAWLTVATAVLAAASFRWVEQPARRSPFLLARPSRTLALAGVAMLATTLVVLASDRIGTSETSAHDELAESVTDEPHGGMLDPSPSPPPPSAAPEPGTREEPPEPSPTEQVVIGLQEEKSDGTFQATLPTEPLIPTFRHAEPAIAPPPLEAGADRDLTLPEDECNAERTSPVTPACDRGDLDSATKVVLVGDSHARMHAPPLVRLAEERGWHLRTYLHNSCPFSLTPRTREADGETVCTEPNAEVMSEILELEPDLVVTTWFAASEFYAPDEEVPGAQGFAQYWNTLEDAGTDVVVLRDIPNAPRDVVDCVVENYESPDVCAEPPSSALRGVELIETALDLAPDVDLVDLTPLFCTTEECRYVIGGILTHRNRDHVTETWALSITDHLETALLEVLERREGDG